jgi:hypothetical protein
MKVHNERRDKMTDGNTYAINKHLDEREDYDALQETYAELEQAEARIEELELAVRYEADLAQQALDARKELEAKLAELLVVVKRAVRLSIDYSNFKLYAMEPLERAIAAAERLTKRTGG